MKITAATILSLVAGLLLGVSASAVEADPDRDDLVNHVWIHDQAIVYPVGGYRSYTGADEVEPVRFYEGAALRIVASPADYRGGVQLELGFFADEFSTGRYGTASRPGEVTLGFGANAACGGADDFTIHSWDPETEALHLTFALKCRGDDWIFGEVIHDMPAQELDIVDGLLATELVRIPAGKVGKRRAEIPVSFVNLGEEQTAIEGLRVTGPARNDYWGQPGEVPYGCRSLAPGETCQKFLGTQVAAPGERRARLEADVRGSDRDLGIRLTQLGLASHDYAYARVDDEDAQGRDRVRDLRSGVGDGMALSRLTNRDTGEDSITKIDSGSQKWRLYLEGPGGQPIDEGRYEIGPRGSGLPYLSSGPANLGCDEGWFEITELVRDSDGEPQRIAGEFDATCDGDVRQRGSFGVSATASPTFPAWAPTVEASFSRRLVPRGRPTTLTVTVRSAPTRGLARVDLYAGGRKLMSTDGKYINRRGEARFRFPRPEQRVPAITRRSTVRVVLGKNPFRPSTRVRVAPRPRLDLSLTDGRRGRQTARVKVSRRTWDCVRMPLQIRRGTSWRTIDRQCVKPGGEGTVTWEAPAPRPRTRTYRVRAVHPTPGDPALRTSWRQFRS